MALFQKSIVLAGFAVMIAMPALAQNPSGPFTPAELKTLSVACTGGKWAGQPCLNAVSASNMALASMYGAALQQANQNAQAENLKQHCAASTAATQGEYPADAMRSAFTECANSIVDISGATGLNPDPTRYQALIGAVWCLTGDAKCASVEQGLLPYTQQ